jgi:hypothetical protein
MRIRRPVGSSERRLPGWASRAFQGQFRRHLMIAVAIAATAALAAVLVAYRPSLIPPGLHARDNEFATATARVLVDTRPSTLLDPAASTGQSGQQTVTYALYLQTDEVKAAIGRAVGLGDKEISATGPFTLLLDRSGTPMPNSAVRSITTPVDRRYRLVADVDGTDPVLTLYSQAPTKAAAIEIIDEARSLLVRHVAAQERSYHVASAFTPVVSTLGGTHGGMVDPTGRLQLMALVFGFVALAGWTIVSTRATRRRNVTAGTRTPAPRGGAVGARRAPDALPHATEVLPYAALPARDGSGDWSHATEVLPYAALPARDGSGDWSHATEVLPYAALPARDRSGDWSHATEALPYAALPPRDRSDDWPHTTRVLPWALAAFLAMIFTMPFEQIALPLPSILSPPDRVFLIAIVALWCSSLAIVRGSARPRTKLTNVHLAAAMFFVVCCASIALGGHALANLTEVAPTVKKLVLLGSFLTFLFVVGSVIRPREVSRYAALIVGLAVLTSLAAIAEYRLHYNVFYNLWSKVLPVSLPPDFGARDNIGRLTVVGPTSQPLELAALIAMAFPFAVIGLINASDRRRRALYALAAAVLIAGGLATERKTAVVAPLVGLAVLLAYRPRPILRGLKLAALPMAVLIHFSAPGAIGSTLHWLMPGTFGSVHTTSDRLARYDAIRPDVMSHLLLGRGFQSYDPLKYRILDNEFLDLLIGVGAIGVLAYVVIYWMILRSAHRVARGPDPRRASLAVACAASVATALVANALFDTLSFPHVPYLLFFIAAMVLALQEQSHRRDAIGFVMQRARRRRGPVTARSMAHERSAARKAAGEDRPIGRRGAGTNGNGSRAVKDRTPATVSKAAVRWRRTKVRGANAME